VHSVSMLDGDTLQIAPPSPTFQNTGRMLSFPASRFLGQALAFKRLVKYLNELI